MRPLRWLLARLGRRRAVAARMEECETCGKLLAPRDAWELRAYPSDALDREFGGGTYMSAIYCRRHFPEGRERHSLG